MALHQLDITNQSDFAVVQSDTTFQWQFAYKTSAINDDSRLKNGVAVYLVNEESKSTVCVNADGAITAKGTTFRDSQWTIVIPTSIVPETGITGHGTQNPVMSFQNVATGQFLSISDVNGALGLVDAASPATKMMVHQIKKDRYQLIHHNDVKNAVGFYGDGKVEEAGTVLAQTRAGSFYICVVSEVAAQWQADETLVDPSKEAAATMIQAGFRGMKGRAAAAAAAAGGSKAPAPWPKEAREF